MQESGLQFSAVERLRKEIRLRGWFAYQLLNASLRAASAGDQRSSLDLLAAGLRTSPVHAPKTLVKYARARIYRKQRAAAQPSLNDA